MTEADMRCIRKLGEDRYEVRLHVGRDSATGKVRQVSRISHGGLRAAQKLRSRLETEIADGEHGGTNGTLGLLFDRWNDHRASLGRSEVTIYNSRRRIDRDIRPALGSMPLDKLTTAHIEGFYDSLRDAAKRWSAMLNIHRDLTGALTYGRKLGWMKANIMEFLTVPEEVEREKTVPEVDEVKHLISAAGRSCRDAHATEMIAVAALTGMRSGELCALRFSAVDVTTGVFTVRSSVWEIGSHKARNYAWGTKLPKSNKTRAFMAPSLAVDIVRHRWQTLVESARLMEVPIPEDAYVWSRDPLGQTPIMPRSVTNMFAKLKAREGVNSRFHDLRGFAGTEMMANGVNLRTIADRMGHSDPSITARLYTKVGARSDTEAAEIMTNIFGSIPELTW